MLQDLEISCLARQEDPISLASEEFLKQLIPPNLAKEFSGMTIFVHINMRRKNRHSKILPTKLGF